MTSVAVLGGGPAGAYAAERLARAGRNVVVADEKLAWEKPCGGGLTYKAYSLYPFLVNSSASRKSVSEIRIAAPKAGGARMILEHPLIIYARAELNQFLLDRAGEAGARVLKTRVLEMGRETGKWLLRTSDGMLRADYCIVATGARNTLREFGTRWTPTNTMQAVGYYVPAEQDHVDLQFLEGLEGYLWVFPRCGHLSVGVCGKAMPARELRNRLETYMEEKGIPREGSRFYSHLIPSLGPEEWRGNRVAGEGWLAVGDAAGLVDPITGEGLYYALRSADLAADVLLEKDRPDEDRASAYIASLNKDFAEDLALAAAIAPRFFSGRFLLGSVPARMVQFMRHSGRFMEVVQDLFAGTQNYATLKSRLFRNLNGTLLELIASYFLSRLIPNTKSI